jgi:CTP synthase
MKRKTRKIKIRISKKKASTSRPQKKLAKSVHRSKSPKRHHKYIFVIGGVMSGVGKGIATSSVGTLLSAKGFRVNLVKVDPYLNVDAGTMNPTEHGEVFVLNSGLETDQDMGNYERFLGRDLTHDDYITSGMVYKHVIEKERALGFGGKCVEAIPHIRDEVVRRFEHAASVNKSDISIIEIGGTIGDYQNIMFIEAARVLKMRHPNDVLFVMVSYLPTPGSIGEMKSRPTQNAARQLASYGVNTDFIIARASTPLDIRRKEKIAISCNIPTDRVISAPDIESIYDVPGNFEKDKFGILLLNALGLEAGKPDQAFKDWKKMAKGIKNHNDKQVQIAIVGKYFNTGDFILSDSYLSVLEAVKFSAYKVGVKAVIHTVNSRDFENDHKSKKEIDYSSLHKFDGIIVPGGFGESGIEGKLNVIRYAREKKIPYFGLCYGMQLMTIEYARNVLGLKDANTAEISPDASHLIIDIMPDQKKKLAEGNYGGSMRLGVYKAKLTKDTIAEQAYGANIIRERHRHRYEVNPKYIDRLEKAGLVFSGKSPDGTLMEIAELPRSKHPFFLGTQFHPEFLARPLSPHPLFTEFLSASKKQRQFKKENEIEDPDLVMSSDLNLEPIPSVYVNQNS